MRIKPSFSPSSRKSALIGISTAFTLACAIPACDCNGEVSVSNNVTLSFTNPADAAIVTHLDDSDAATAGIQKDVVVRADGARDGTVVLLSNDVDVDASGNPVTVSATVSDKSVTFPAYTIPRGAITLHATTETCNADNCKTDAHLTVVDSLCKFNTPKDGDVLYQDLYPNAEDRFDPFETDMTFDCFGVSAGDNVALAVGEGHAVVVQATGSSQIVFQKVQLAEGPNTLLVLPRTDATGVDPTGTSASASVTVDTGHCIVNLVPADGTSILAKDDLDSDPTSGMQTRIDVVTTCGTDAAVNLFLKGPDDSDYAELTITPESRVAEGSEARIRFTNVQLPESKASYDVHMVAQVAATADGKTGTSLPTDYWVDSTVPQLVSFSPGDGSCVGDADPTRTGVQINATGHVTGAEASSEVWVSTYPQGGTPEQCVINDECAGYDPSCVAATGCVRCRDDECRLVSRLTEGTQAQSGDFVANGVTATAGVVTVKYVVLDLAGNQAQTTVAVSALAASPTVIIPEALNNAQLTAAQDTDAATPGLQYALELTTTDIPAGATGTIVISGQAPQTFVPVVGTGTTTVTISLDDGQHTIKAVLEDSCGVNPQSNEVTVNVDSTPPDITVTAYESGGFATRTAIADNGYTKVSAIDLDVVVGTGAAGRTLAVTLYSAIASGTGDRSCSGSAGATATQTLSATDVGFTFTNLTLTEGVNCIAVTLTDSINNASATYVVNRRTSAPGVTITSPDDPSSFTGADDSDSSLDGFNHTILAELAFADFSTGTLDIELRPVGSDTAFARVEQRVSAGITSVVFADASLPAGDYDLVAVYTDQLGNVSESAAVHITVNLGSGPQVAISAPRDGETVSTSVSVTLTRLGGSTPTGCTLLIDGAAGSLAAWADTSSPLVIAGVSLTDGEHVIQASCTDGTNTLFTQSVTVTADSTPPDTPELASETLTTDGRLDFDTSPSYVNSLTADTSSAAGLQHTVRVLVHTGGQSIQGFRVQLTVTPPGASPTTYERTLNVGGEPTQVSFDSVDFGSNDGNITFSVVVIDTLSRSSTADTATLTIDRTAPTISLTTPPPTQEVLTRDDDRQTGSVDTIEVVFAIATSGVSAGDTVSLDIEPNPGGVTLPIVQTASATVSFPQVSFPSGQYAATFTVTDVAGNSSEVVYNFEVRTVDTKVELTAPVATILNASYDVSSSQSGLQAVFNISASGFESGSSAVLCSTVATPGASTQCGFGQDGSGNTVALQGSSGVIPSYIIASGSLNGILQSTSVVLTSLIAEGQQTIHVEARELDSDPFVASTFRTVLVDSEPPVVQAASFTGNDTTNDEPGLIRLNASEGIPNGGSLRVTLVVTISGLENARVVTVSSDGSVIGTTQLTDTTATFAVDVPAGAHTLTFSMTDAAGNQNTATTDIVKSLPVEVDFTTDSVSLAAPQANPYTATAGTVSGSELVLASGLSIIVSTGDTNGGGKITLERYAASSGGSALESQEITLNAGQGSASFTSFRLVQGINWLQAKYADRAANTTVSTRIAYKADFIGPTLELGVRDKNGTVSSCTSSGSSCLADTLPRGSSDYTIRLDRDGSNPTCGGTSCSGNGTDLFYTLGQCVNSDASIETCPISVHLQSRVTSGSSTTDWADVTSGIFSSSDAADATSILTDPQFEPGIMRELRLSALDSNGNQSFSPSVFLTLNFEGVAVQVERLDGSQAATGDILANDRFFGIAESTIDAASGRFTTNFRARLSSFGSAVPTTTRMTIDAGTFHQTYEFTVNNSTSGLYTDFVGVELAVATDPASPTTNTITLQAMCGTDVCGPREYSGVVADIAAPTYQFDRCSLCALNVPLSGLDCNSCASADSDASANIAVFASGDTSTSANWNLALDSDHDGSNGFNASQLIVKLTGLENDQQVKLTTDVGTLTNATAPSTGCPTAATCVATFNALQASSLSGSDVRKVSVSFTDKAGNSAKPDAVRGDATREAIYARTDVIAPAGVTATVCIGESTTPSGSSDAATVESSTCTAVCAATSSCDRLAASASLRWTVPGDDGSSGSTTPSGYIIGAAALGIPYTKTDGGTVTYTACSDVTADGPFETTVPAPTPLQQTGGSEQVAVPGLFPHRDYCFGVFAIDDGGNRSPGGTAVARRKIPIITAPSIQPFDGTPGNRDDAQTVGAFYTDPEVSSDFGASAASLPDLDGDSRNDYAVARWTSGQVLVFLSASTGDLNTPSITITAPSIGDSGSFGAAIAGGDFDGDGHNDLIICDPNVQTTSFAQAGAHGGALFLYYGVGGADGIARTSNSTDNQLPSLKPDVALLGRAEQHLCVNVAIADVDGDAKADIVGTTNEVATTDTTPRVYGIHGGSRSRFQVASNPKAYLDLDAAAASGGPDFTIAGNSGAGSFPWKLELGDYNGDGTFDIAVSDPLAAPGGCSACGEVYVYHGGTGITGTLPIPSNAGTDATTVRYLSTGFHFGANMTTVHHPRVTDSADWLLVGTLGNEVLVFKGGGADVGFLDGTYPLAADQYVLLDKLNWDGSTPTRYGRALTSLGNFDGKTGIEIAIGPGFAASGGPFGTFIYTFDQTSDVFVKRAILVGAFGFGSIVTGVSGFIATGPADRSQLFVTYRNQAQVFLFR